MKNLKRWISFATGMLLSAMMAVQPFAAAADSEKPEPAYPWPLFNYVDQSFPEIIGNGFSYQKVSFSTYYPENKVLRLGTDTEANYVVTGIFSKNNTDTVYYVLKPVGFDRCGDTCFIDSGDLNQEVRIGDLYDIEAVCGLDSFQYPWEVYGEIRFCGNGQELYGEDFTKVMRNELVTVMYDCTPVIPDDLLIYGDATNDTDVSLTDVVAVNQNILGVRRLGSYAQQVSDVDRDGEITANDSLRILRYTVSLTDSLD